MFLSTTTSLLPILLGGLLALPQPANAAVIEFNPRATNNTNIPESGTLEYYADSNCASLVQKYTIFSGKTTSITDISFWVRYSSDEPAAICSIDVFLAECSNIGKPDNNYFLPALAVDCTPLASLYQCVRMDCLNENAALDG